MSYELKDPYTGANSVFGSFDVNVNSPSSYTNDYSERIRLALTVIAALNNEERTIFKTAIDKLFAAVPDATVMVRTGPLQIQCPYCGRS